MAEIRMPAREELLRIISEALSGCYGGGGEPETVDFQRGE
jgi:hypothetical protein